MKRLLIVIIGFLLLLASSCKKEITEDPSAADFSGPVFYFNGTINSSRIYLPAGVDDYYMYSYFKQDSSNGLYSFWGNIRQVNCANCANHIAFKIYDSNLSAIGGASHIDTTIIPGKYSYDFDTITSAKKLVTFTPSSSPDDTVQSYHWDFGDGATSSLLNPVHEYNFGTYYVCLRITYTNGCQGVSCNQIVVGALNNDCNVTVLDTALTGNVVGFGAGTIMSTPVTYNWNFADTISGSDNFSTQQFVRHNFSAPGIYRVNIHVSSTNCKTYLYKNIATPNYTTGCYSNYTFSIFSGTQYPFSKIVIYWKDAAGTTYSSENVVQPTDSYFEVLSVDGYLLNENKQRTKKIHARLKCLVSNGTSSVTVTDGDAVFAIAFP
jgi:PKD repeat protein